MLSQIHRIVFFVALLSLAYSFECRSQEFYPLDSGNIWSLRVDYNRYPLPTDYSQVQIRVKGDTIMPNGLTYACLSQPDALGAEFVRVDSLHVSYYSAGDSTDVPVYNLRSKPGEVDSTNWRGLFTSELSSLDTARMFGCQVLLRRYAFDGIVVFRVTLADKFGVTDALDLADGGWPYYYTDWQLQGCVVRDTLYGVMSSIFAKQSLPSDLVLYQNYPNPFNPVTTIAYDLPTSSLVQLRVTTLLGQQVALLIDGFKTKGRHTVSFDASRLASGQYFAVLSTPAGIRHRVMILLK